MFSCRVFFGVAFFVHRFSKDIGISLMFQSDPQFDFMKIIQYRMGPPVDSVQLPYKWLNMVDITIVNGGYFMVYKPRNISGGPYLV